MQIPSYNKILALGHSSIRDILLSPVEITEKLDGSQFAFGRVDGRFGYRSKGRQIPLTDPYDGDMFAEGRRHAEVLNLTGKLPENTVFFCEYLKKPKHNVLGYARIPKNHLALWAVKKGDEFVSDHHSLSVFAEALDIEVIPLVGFGMYRAEEVMGLIRDRVSALGGCNVEGVVIKNYALPCTFGPVVFPISCGKFVSEQFKEVAHKGYRPKVDKKTKWDAFKDAYITPARWHKAVQILRERGELTGTPQDIGSLLKVMRQDITEECKDEILEFLWGHFGEELLKDASRPFPSWYKEQLALGGVVVER